MQGERVIGTGRKSESKGKHFRAEGGKKTTERVTSRSSTSHLPRSILLKIPLFTGAELHKVTFTCPFML